MKIISTISMIFTLCLISMHTFAEENPIFLKRYGLVVGSNTGTEDRAELKYAVSDAEAFRRVLLTMGGVAKDDLILIKNPNLNDYINGLKQLYTKVKKGVDSQGRKEIIIYYSGHADEKGIILGNESLPYTRFRKIVNDIPVDVRIAVFDACASGSLTREKGGVQRPAFLFDASSAMKGHAYLTSSSHDEAAQESDRIKASFFTHYLLSGMRGGADANSDGKVTLNEAYEFAFHETLRRTEKTQAGPQHAAYDIRLKGSGDLVMTDLRASSAALRLSPAISGRVFVRETDGTLLAEINKKQGKQMEIGLEPGTYKVTLEKPAQVLSSDITLSKGKYTDLIESNMNKIDTEFTTKRGTPAIEEARDPTGDYRIVPFNLSVVPAVSIGGGTEKILTHCAINLAAGYTSKLQGISISSGINIVTEEAEGALIGAGGNLQQGRINGIQIAGGINTAGDTSNCAQISGGFNKIYAMKGIQITGGANIATGSIPGGAQIAGGYNSTAGNINGIQIVGGMNITSDSSNCAQIAGGINKAKTLKGIQIAGGANISSGSIPGGAQIAGGGNITFDDVKGIQIAGGFNKVKSCYGAQIAGGANIANGLYNGIQISGGINITEKINGAQIGIVNVAHRAKGAQIGVVNICDSCTGIPIGVFSFMRNNPPHARIWTDEAGYLHSGIRSGSKYFYSLFSLGARMGTDPYGWSLGWGLGGRIPIGKSFIGLEQLFLHTNETTRAKLKWDRNQLLHIKNTLVTGFQFAKHFSVWGGPTLNIYLSSEESEKKLAYWDITLREFRRVWYAVWPGFTVGVEF